MKKRFAWALLMTTMLLVGCTDTSQTVKTVKIMAEAEPQTTFVKKREIEVATYQDAQVTYYTEQLSFEQEGEFGEYKVALGDTVTKGQVLATTNQESLEKELERLRETLDEIVSNYKYESAILEKQREAAKKKLDATYVAIEEAVYMSPEFTALCCRAGSEDQDVLEIELKIKQLKETYDSNYPYYAKQVNDCKKKIGANLIKAPYDGIVVGMLPMQSKDHVNPESYYIAIADPTRTVVLTEYMTDMYLSSYKEEYALINGNKYDLEYIPMDENIIVKIRESEGELHSMFLITNPDEHTKPGDIAIFACVRERKENVLSIPAMCIRGDSGGRFVYKKVNGQKEKAYIKLSIANDIYSGIAEGLEEGDEVYVTE